MIHKLNTNLWIPFELLSNFQVLGYVFDTCDAFDFIEI